MNKAIKYNNKLVTVCVVILSLVLIFFPAAQILGEEAEDWIYTTRHGDNLWDLSKQYLQSANDWKKLKKYNQIVEHKKMAPGTRLRFPVKWLKKQPTPVLVESVTGSAKYSEQDNKAKKTLSAGDHLNIGSSVFTDNNASVTLKFADGSRLFIQQNSILRLDALSAHAENGMVDTRAQLQRGRAESRVVPFKNTESRYEITTPAAVASVRGTEFRVTMNDKTDTMSSEVLTGKVAVASEGVTQIIPAGFGTRAIKGRPPEPARELLGAPDLSNLPTQIRTRPLLFKWANLKNALSYRVQFASNIKFQKILLDTTVTTPEVSWQQSDKGSYAIRVRGIDASGLEGKDSTHGFSIANEIPAPTPVFPRNDQQLNKKDVAFQWRAHSDARRFLLQVANDPHFDANVIEVSGSQMHYSSRKALPIGTYYWRVANEYANGIFSEFSDVYSFQIND